MHPACYRLLLSMIGLAGLLLALAPPLSASEKPIGTFASAGATQVSIYANANLRGVLVRVGWKDIETTPGVFNFSAIDNQVAAITGQGRSWSLAVIGGGTGSPSWLTDSIGSGGLGAPWIEYSFRGVPGYRLPLIWDATVQNRMAQLASALATRYGAHPDLKLVYVTQMSANGIEGHLQGVNMNTLIAAGTDQDGDGDVDAADFSRLWIAASKQVSRAFALAFSDKALAFEVHDVNGTHTIPATIIQDLWADPTLGQRVGAAMWWISGRSDYQSQLIAVLNEFPGDIYGQVIGKSRETAWTPNTTLARATLRMPVNPPATQRFRYEVITAGVSGAVQPQWPLTPGATVVDGTVVWICRASHFANGDFTTVFQQAKTLGMRYIEPWEWEFNNTPNSANGEWDAALADFNSWADTTFGGGNTSPTITGFADQFTMPGVPVGPLAFTVGDGESAATSLSVHAGSSNQALLPNGNIAITGDGANRTLTLSPLAGSSGSAIVTLSVSDGALTTETRFGLVVGGQPTVTALSALHRNGQTYLSWNDVAQSNASYRIYRSTSPFTSIAQLVDANLLGTASADSSFDARLSALRSTNLYFRINPAGPDLTAAQGVFVSTPTVDGSSHYAIMAVVDGVSQQQLVSGQNTTAAIVEVVAQPEPVLQRTLSVGGRNVDVYVHWVSASSTPFYPAMGNRHSVAHHFGLVRRGTGNAHSLLIRPHARNGSFLANVTGTTDAEEWVLTLDDWMPNSIDNTFWYGYHESFDIDAGGLQGSSGIVRDYTTQRAIWEIEWARRTQPLDLDRLYMAGHSMGGIGSHFLSLMMPDRIAAIWTTSAKYDFSFLTDPNPANIWNAGANERAASGDILWGTVATNLISSDNVPVYDRLNAGFLANALRSVDQPVMIAFHGKNDVVVGWAEKLGFYDAMNASRHGGMFYFDSGVHNRSGGEWVPQQNINALNRYRLDSSYPAFSNSSANGNPGNGNVANGQPFGTINGNLDWDPATIVDTQEQWRITLRTVALNSTSGVIAAPANAVVDVTPRRLQAFAHAPNSQARFEVRNAAGTLINEGLVTADAAGLFTVPAVSVSSAGTTLALFAGSTLYSDGFEAVAD